MNADEIPDDLHPMQYATEILECQLGWPLKTNGELMADCIKSIQRAKSLTAKQAHAYITRAIKLAKEQGIEVNRLFFMNGDYVNVRPAVKESMRPWQRIDWEKTRQEQETPEFKAASERARTLLARIAGKTQIP